MFKKIEIWVLYFVILVGFLLAVLFGAIVRHEVLGGKLLRNNNLGWLGEAAIFLAELPVNTKRIADGPHVDNKVNDRFDNINGFKGVQNNFPAYLLLSRYDGDLKEGVVELVNLTDFTVLHTWNPDIDMFNDLVEQVDEFKYLNRDLNNKKAKLVHPKLTNDGGLLFNSSPLRKINSCSN